MRSLNSASVIQSRRAKLLAGMIDSYKRKALSVLYSGARALIIMGIAYIILFPILTKLSVSFMTRTDIWDQTVCFVPKQPTLNNYRLAFQGMNYPKAFANSVVLTLLVSGLQLVSCTTIAYGFARFRFWGREFWFALLVIFSLVIPPELILTPLYLTFRFFNFWGLVPGKGMNLLDSYWPFVLTSVTGTGVRNGLFIYIMRQFFRGMPRDMEEAAFVDGAGPFRTFLQVMVPGAVPGMVVVFLFSFVWQWNDYLLTSMFLPKLTVLPMSLQGLGGAILRDLEAGAQEELSLLNSAGVLMLMAPLVVLYVFLQRYFVESVQRSGIVG
jgi:multiple sugar transport system permease protein